MKEISDASMKPHSNTNPSRVSIWILRGDSAGVALNFCLRRLASRTLLFVACCAIGVYAASFFSPTDDELNEESLALLREYMARRITKLEDPQSGINVGIEEDSERSNIEANLDRKIKLLVDELIRVRSYEKQLQTRTAVLESILDSTVELGDESLGAFSDTSGESAKAPSQYQGEENGVGGAEFTASPLFSVYPSLANRMDDGSRTLNLVEKLELQIDQLSKLPIGTPVEGRSTSRFGHRRSPFSGERHFHQGFDIAVASRSVVEATADGVVVFAGNKAGYGQTVVIEHGNGVETLYGHLSRIGAKLGQKVCRGQTVGYVGSTGRSTGPHVHYEVRIGGAPQDPLPYIQLASLLKSVK
ncbi:MAG: M23 family metallopeptidase [Bdellovibrionales bacterium]|nr:M23 family metallopeptidase [Bdellovibrionales bacterium]